MLKYGLEVEICEVTSSHHLLNREPNRADTGKKRLKTAFGNVEDQYSALLGDFS